MAMAAERVLHVVLSLTLCVPLEGAGRAFTGASLQAHDNFPVTVDAHSTAWARRLLQCIDDWHASFVEGAEEVEAKQKEAGASSEGFLRSRKQQTVAPRTAFGIWENAKSQNAAIGWSTKACISRAHSGEGLIRLDDSIKEQASCFASALGAGRAYHCACEQGDRAACTKKNALLKSPALAPFAEAIGVDTGKLLLTGPRSGWFCSPEVSFGALGVKLLTPDMDSVLQQAAPELAERWGSSMMKQLAHGRPDLANNEVAKLDDTEVQLIAASMLEALPIDHSILGSLRSDFLGEVATEARRLPSRAAAIAGVPAPCVDARRRCFKDMQCRKIAESLVPESGAFTPEAFLSEVLEHCQAHSALLGALEVKAECPRPLIQGAEERSIQHAARAASQDIVKLSNPCAHAKEVEQILTSKFLPSLLASVPFQVVPLACVEAYDECQRDEECHKTISAQNGMNSDRLLSETGKLCTKPEAMLRAVNVIADCPAAVPNASARVLAERLRKDLPGVAGPKMCNATSRLLSSALPNVHQDIATSQVPSLRCIKAHQRCGAEPKCGSAVEAMVKQSSSKERMLAEALKLCSSRSAMLLALEVSYECPGMLPAKEARESHDALALVPETQLCKKMQELTQVLTVLLSPATSLDCKAARRDCRESTECGATWKRLEQHGDGASNMTMLEIVKLCHDKHAMFTALRMVMECEDHFPRDVLRDAYYVLEPVREQELCSETQSLLGRLGPQALKTLTLSMSSAAVPISCTSAHQRCGSRLRCGAAAIAMETQARTSPTEEVTEMLKLCDDKADFFAVLDVAAECPSHVLSQEMRDLRQRLQDIPEPRLCVEAVKHVGVTLLPLVLPAMPPAACGQAHRACVRDAKCVASVQEVARPGLLSLHSFLPLCNRSPQTFLSALRVLVECPGPQPREGLRSALAVFNQASPEKLCERAETLLNSNASLSAAVLDLAMATAAEEALPGVALKLASSTIEAFDFAPKDGKLNAVEMEAMKTQAATVAGASTKPTVNEHRGSKSLTLSDSNASAEVSLQDLLQSMNLQAADAGGDKLVEAKQLASELTPRLRPVLERLALNFGS
mmetsp:Transcript_11211/g.21119  ORF Transcript_11211/g.21119 Transcript_11211/m.21119 type:complete len:1082 (+) Transcript_11211:73-3318(+)